MLCLSSGSRNLGAYCKRFEGSPLKEVGTWVTWKITANMNWHNMTCMLHILPFETFISYNNNNLHNNPMQKSCLQQSGLFTTICWSAQPLTSLPRFKITLHLKPRGKVCHGQERNEVRWRPCKKQVWCHRGRTWALSEANLLYWRKYLWHCWDFSAPS